MNANMPCYCATDSNTLKRILFSMPKRFHEHQHKTATFTISILISIHYIYGIMFVMHISQCRLQKYILEKQKQTCSNFICSCVCILWQVIIETSRYKTRILFQIMLDIILLSHIFHITIELNNKDIKVL